MKIIGIDCRFAQEAAGLGRYTRELVGHLLGRQDGFRYVLFVRKEGEAWAASLPGKPEVVVADIPHYSFAEQSTLPRLFRAARPDLLFVPHFNVPLTLRIPFVATVHDLILHRFPGDASFPRRTAYRFVMRSALRRARRVVTISRFTASEIRDVYGESVARKVTVVPPGIGEAFHPRTAEEKEAVLRRFGILTPYFLYVGNAKEHKNVPMLIEAFEAAAVPGAALVLVTGGREATLLHAGGNVRFFSPVSDDDLPALYAGARACVTASLYEGFGLPVAEAAACGCPIIASDRAAIPEAAPQESMLIEPTVDAFAAAFRSPPPPPAPERRFRWDDAAAGTAAILQAAISGNN